MSLGAESGIDEHVDTGRKVDSTVRRLCCQRDEWAVEALGMLGQPVTLYK